ncbi:MAG: COG1361 S-layer family protein [Candidatus Aenigmarchaeota archaeon]|nr:COG1361 S-layer family protein [Candidatus Aenigmarchaeota archaeon]
MKLVKLLVWLVLIVPFVYSQTYVSLKTTYSTMPELIEPGDIGSIILTLTNYGNTYAKNVKVKFFPNTEIELSKTEFNLQTIPAGDSKQISIPFKVLENIKHDTIAILYTVEYSVGESSGTKEMDSSIILTITRKPNVEIIFAEPMLQNVSLGHEFTLSIRIKNVGKGDAKDVVLSIDTSNLPFIPIKRSSELYLGDLERNEMRDVSFDFIVNDDADIKAYQIPLTLTYSDNQGNLYETDKMIGIKVMGKAELIKSIDEVEYVPEKGMWRVSFLVANKGVDTAKYLTARLKGLKTMPSEVYIGNIDPDDYETVEFEIPFEELATGVYNVSLVLEYKDSYNNAHIEEKTFNINFEMPRKSSNYLTIVLVIGAITLGLLYWKKWRKKRR